MSYILGPSGRLQLYELIEYCNKYLTRKLVALIMWTPPTAIILFYFVFSPER